MMVVPDVGAVTVPLILIEMTNLVRYSGGKVAATASANASVNCVSLIGCPTGMVLM